MFLVTFVIGSCQQDKETDLTKLLNQDIYSLMEEIYLWYDHLPPIDPRSYQSPESLIEALRYLPYDRWSTVIPEAEYNQYFEEGKMIGHGVLLSYDGANIRIAFVYRSTQAYASGVRRSWIIKKVNGKVATSANVFDLLGPSEAGVQNTIEFLDKEGQTVTLTLLKEEIEITPVLDYQVISHGDKKIGYLVFQDFIEAAKPELDEAFESIASAGIDEMVLDMRYNGGGSVDVAEYLSSWLIGKDFGGQPLVNFRHNDKYASWDTTINLKAKPEGLSLNRLFFIGTGSTASASELVINGASPFLETVLAGETTHGKPVGMYVFPFTRFEYMVMPICFKGTNANEDGDFYDGLVPDIAVPDDLSKDFGDPEEGCLAAILGYIDGEAIPLKRTGTGAYESKLIEKDTPISEFLKAY